MTHQHFFCVSIVVLNAFLPQTNAFFLKSLFLKPFLGFLKPTTTPEPTTPAYTYPPAPVYPAMPSGYPAFPVFQMPSYGGGGGGGYGGGGGGYGGGGGGGGGYGGGGGGGGGYGGGGGGGYGGGGGSYYPPPAPPPYIPPAPPPYVPPPPPYNPPPAPCPPPAYDLSGFGRVNSLGGSGSLIGGTSGISGLPPAPTYELISGSSNQGFSEVSAANLVVPSGGSSRNDLDPSSLDWPRVDPRKVSKFELD